MNLICAEVHLVDSDALIHERTDLQSILEEYEDIAITGGADPIVKRT